MFCTLMRKLSITNTDVYRMELHHKQTVLHAVVISHNDCVIDNSSLIILVLRYVCEMVSMKCYRDNKTIAQ